MKSKLARFRRGSRSSQKIVGGVVGRWVKCRIASVADLTAVGLINLTDEVGFQEGKKMPFRTVGSGGKRMSLGR
jgi:hypothetical protein